MPNDKIIHELKEFAQRANSYNGQMVSRIRDDLAFAGGKQYGETDRATRGDNRCEFQFNLIRGYANQIINEYRAKPFGITVSAKRSDSMQKAELAQSIIRGIESMCDAQSAYTLGIDRQVKGGLGFVVVTTDYTNAKSFEQDIKINAIHRPDLVIYDPHSKSVSGEDATEAAFVEHISEELAEQILGEERDWKYISKPLAGTTWSAPDDSVALITYFRLKKSRKTIYQGDNGEVLSDVKNPKNMKSRTVVDTSVCVYRIVGDEVVGETELPLSRLPIVPFRGELVDKDNKLDWVGLTYFARDTQKLVNYAASLTAERISVGPKATNFVDMKSIINYKDIWAKSNRVNLPYLPYDSSDEAGNTFTPPTPRDISVNITDVTSATQAYQGMMASVLGMSENGTMATGASNETAAAVLTRQKSTEINNYQYLDNASKSVKAVGRVILELMNLVYDTERMMPLSTDGTTELAPVNVAAMDIIPDELEVSVDSGPMLETQRQQAIGQLIALGQMVGPDAALVFADDIVRNSDMPDAESIATKLGAVAKMKFGIGQDNSGQPDPEATAALDQASATIDNLQQQMQQMQQYIMQMQVEKQVAEIQSKAKIITQKMSDDTKVYLKELEINATNEVTLAKIKADYEMQQSKAQAELMKLYATQPPIQISPNADPRMAAIDGLRNNY